MSSTAAATTSHSNTVPPKYRPVGVALAIGSGVLIGSSFVFKKKGLLSSQKGHVAGEGVAYLKSPLWWSGMTIMILGEICNLVAYSFLEAIIVTPMGALSVVISAMLSHLILKEKLSLFGWVSCVQCLLGATILALNGPEEQSVTTIAGFKKLFLAPGFLSYGSVIIATAVVLAVFVAPRWGQRSMLPHIGICSLIGGLSVSCTQGLGACIVTSIRGENQFKNWFIYFLLAFVIITLLTEVYYLNVALALFNTAMVTPTYYVMFTFCTLVTSVILYQGLKATATQIMTVVLAFFVICSGIFILQMSKVNPRDLVNIDQRTSLLLQAARAEVDPKAAREFEREISLVRSGSLISRKRNGTTSTYTSPHVHAHPAVNGADIERLADRSQTYILNGTGDGDLDLEHGALDPEEEDRAVVEKIEDPGIDALRGTFGAVGTIIRARRRASALAQVHARARAASESTAMDRRLRGVSGNGFVRGDPEKGVLPSVFVDTPEEEGLRGAEMVGGRAGEGGSAPILLGRDSRKLDDPITQAGAVPTDAVQRRALTLPTVLKSDEKPSFLEDLDKST